uniref:Retrotransposon gag domain-containing protein n=1 Tax=Tanacetum cinerariifolium TaxID=118510 RepID=A0A6L2NKS6_TANCI|nr:hypothetical protein [Tanacetum cinerariifolium]
MDSLDLDGSITTWDDLTTRFLAQFFPPRRTTKLRNDILKFQQHHRESISEAWTRFKDLLQKAPHHDIDRPSPQPQALETTFEARIWDYMAAHTERMERFENAIFKQREHKINEKLIKGLVNNNRFNNSRSRTGAGKKKGKEYKVLPGGLVYDVILKKKITNKEDIKGNFEIPCSVGDLKHVNALVDQGSDVNIMPYSMYMKLIDERPVEIDIRLSLASHSYIYPLGIAKDVLVEVVEHVYPVDFVILDIKENERRPFILGTPFLTTAKASIKFDKGTITLRS